LAIKDIRISIFLTTRTNLKINARRCFHIDRYLLALAKISHGRGNRTTKQQSPKPYR